MSNSSFKVSPLLSLSSTWNEQTDLVLTGEKNNPQTLNCWALLKVTELLLTCTAQQSQWNTQNIPQVSSWSQWRTCGSSWGRWRWGHPRSRWEWCPCGSCGCAQTTQCEPHHCPSDGAATANWFFINPSDNHAAWGVMAHKLNYNAP